MGIAIRQNVPGLTHVEIKAFVLDSGLLVFAYTFWGTDQWNV